MTDVSSSARTRTASRAGRTGVGETVRGFADTRMFIACIETKGFSSLQASASRQAPFRAGTGRHLQLGGALHHHGGRRHGDARRESRSLTSIEAVARDKPPDLCSSRGVPLLLPFASSTPETLHANYDTDCWQLQFAAKPAFLYAYVCASCISKACEAARDCYTTVNDRERCCTIASYFRCHVDMHSDLSRAILKPDGRLAA